MSRIYLSASAREGSLKLMAAEAGRLRLLWGLIYQALDDNVLQRGPKTRGEMYMRMRNWSKENDPAYNHSRKDERDLFCEL